jgi:ferrous iron transport protein A
MTTLNQMRPGQEAEILRVQGADAIACRLREMGFIPGETVVFVRAAPLGDPLKCIIQGSRIALRAAEARRISVVACASTAEAAEPACPAAAHPTAGAA